MRSPLPPPGPAGERAGAHSIPTETTGFPLLPQKSVTSGIPGRREGWGKEQKKTGPSISGILKVWKKETRPGHPCRDRVFSSCAPPPVPRTWCGGAALGARLWGSLTRIPGPLWVGWGWDWRAPGTARWADDHIVPVPEPGGARDTNEAGWAHPGWGAPGGLSRVAVCRPSLSIPP